MLCNFLMKSDKEGNAINFAYGSSTITKDLTLFADKYGFYYVSLKKQAFD